MITKNTHRTVTTAYLTDDADSRSHTATAVERADCSRAPAVRRHSAAPPKRDFQNGDRPRPIETKTIHAFRPALRRVRYLKISYEIVARRQIYWTPRKLNHKSIRLQTRLKRFGLQLCLFVHLFTINGWSFETQNTECPCRKLSIEKQICVFYSSVTHWAFVFISC